MGFIQLVHHEGFIEVEHTGEITVIWEIMIRQYNKMDSHQKN